MTVITDMRQLEKAIYDLVDCLQEWRSLGTECARLDGDDNPCTECDGRIVESGDHEQPSHCNKCGIECECADCYDLIVIRRALALVGNQ